MNKHFDAHDEMFLTGKATTISRAAIRETRVSRHYRGPTEALLKPPEHQSTILLRGSWGALNRDQDYF